MKLKMKFKDLEKLVDKRKARVDNIFISVGKNNNYTGNENVGHLTIDNDIIDKLIIENFVIEMFGDKSFSIEVK